MKKFSKILLFLVLAVFLMVGSAAATPQYNGDTYADYGVGGTPGDPNLNAAGYYIWTNDFGRKSWSIRWTGNELGTTPSDPYDQWFGMINLDGNSLEPAPEDDPFDPVTSTNPAQVLFEFGNVETFDVEVVAGDYEISWEAVAGPHYDGIDFWINGVVGNQITFDLGSTLFNGLGGPTGDPVSGSKIFIGQDSVTPDVYASLGSADGNYYQEFHIAAPVPEPTTMLLLGSGLIGLAGLGRKKFFKKG